MTEAGCKQTDGVIKSVFFPHFPWAGEDFFLGIFSELFFIRVLYNVLSFLSLSGSNIPLFWLACGGVG